MKLSKIFILASAVLAFTACSEDDEWNSTNGATVSMGQETMSVKESKGMFNVPITVTGERNAPVQVTVEVVAASENAATEDKHYLVTSKTINIAPEDEVGKIEIIAVDDDEINVAREFTVNIISVKGATINQEKKSTVITLKDNDSAFYEKLGGKWVMTGIDPTDGSPLSWNVNVIAADEEDEDYEKYLYVTGMMGYSWTMATLTYDYDMETGAGSLTFEPGQLFAEDLNFNLGGYNDVYIYGFNGRGFTMNSVSGTWSEDFKTVTFAEGEAVAGAITDKQGNLIGFLWFAISDIKMTR